MCPLGMYVCMQADSWCLWFIVDCRADGLLCTVLFLWVQVGENEDEHDEGKREREDLRIESKRLDFPFPPFVL